MNVTLQLADGECEAARVIANLWPLYVHDNSQFAGDVPNRHGVLCQDDDIANLRDQAASNGAWFRESGALFPYLIRVDGQPAGFNLIAARHRLPEELDADFVVYEFFVLHAFRGAGVAQRAACAGFENHRGQWEVVAEPKNLRAVAFWTRAIGEYAATSFHRAEVDHVWGRKVAFRFDNGDAKHGDKKHGDTLSGDKRSDGAHDDDTQSGTPEP